MLVKYQLTGHINHQDVDSLGEIENKESGEIWNKILRAWTDYGTINLWLLLKRRRRRGCLWSFYVSLSSFCASFWAILHLYEVVLCLFASHGLLWIAFMKWTSLLSCLLLLSQMKTRLNLCVKSACVNNVHTNRRFEMTMMDCTRICDVSETWMSWRCFARITSERTIVTNFVEKLNFD